MATSKEIEEKHYSDTIKVSLELFNKFNDALDCKILGEESRVLDIIKFQNTAYTPVSSVHFWNDGNPRDIIKAYKILPLEFYDGDLKPLHSSAHHIEVQKGSRKEGYNGQLVTFRGKKHVLCEDSILIEVIKGNEQTSLF